ncbi:MAG: hypothetical protein ABR586_06285 [Thermoplasmatota archaeon]
MARTAPFLTLTLLLLAGCMEQADDGTGTSMPPPPAAGPAPRWENVTLSSNIDFRAQGCAIPLTVFQQASPKPVDFRKGDTGLRATFTWTAATPAAQEMTVALLASDDVVLAEAGGPSPLVLTATAHDLEDVGDDPLSVVAEMGACHGTPAAGASAMQQVAVAILWNPPP